jgi:hypothetical protein
VHDFKPNLFSGILGWNPFSVRGLDKSYRMQTGERKPYCTLHDDPADFGTVLLGGDLKVSLNMSSSVLTSIYQTGSEIL